MRYFTRPHVALWVEDEYCAPSPGHINAPLVPEHIATDTGLVDVNGDSIMRAPNPVGFVWSDE